MPASVDQSIFLLLRTGAGNRGDMGADASDRRGVLRDAVYGSRQMVRHLRRNSPDAGRRRVRRLMAKMGLTPIYQRLARAIGIRSIGSILICYANWRSSGLTMCGAPP